MLYTAQNRIICFIRKIYFTFFPFDICTFWVNKVYVQKKKKNNLRRCLLLSLHTFEILAQRYKLFDRG